jgi:hypothetical protein
MHNLISRLTAVPLRELWRHEALDFTTWLAENLDFVSDTLGIQISFVERESAAGSFSADILAEDQMGNAVVIENQLESTDHDHLGKLLTYLANFNAKIAIWITSNPRPEHEQAIRWLNEALPVDTAFYLLKIEAFRIDDSAPAPLFTIVAGPSATAREVGHQKKELAERHVLRLEFWEQLLARANQRTTLHSRISPSKDHWISTGAGRSGLSLNYVILMDAARVELYIDTADAERNLHYFETLYAAREQIESTFGAPLDWQRLTSKRACRVAYHTDGGLKNHEQWPTIQDAMIDAMSRLHKSLQPVINRLP